MEMLATIAALLTASLTAFCIKRRTVVEGVSVAAAAVAFAAAVKVGLAVAGSGVYAPFPFFWVDGLGAITVLMIATVGLAATIYSVAYLRRETAKGIVGLTRVRQYFGLLNLFLLAMFVGISASSPLFTWVFIEATTLSTVFLISFYNRASTMEAAWKYLIINSIGLLLALMGTLLFSSAGEGVLTWESLLANPLPLDPQVVQMAFILVLIGYGTKAGLAPMHTWLPDAHSKAAAPISALMSGVLLSVAFAVVLRFAAVTNIAVGQSFSQRLLIGFGLVSVVLAGVIMVTQKKYKRLLAYSSVENMGIMALGIGFGGIGALAAILHMVYHSLIKSSLFLTAGSIFLRYSSSRIADIKGLLTVLPVTGVLFLAGLFAAAGMPPFGLFLTEFFTLSAGLKVSVVAAVVLLFALVAGFIGFLRAGSNMAFSAKPADIPAGEKSFWLVAPPLVLLALALVLTFYMPPFMQTLIDQAVSRYM